LSCGMCLYVRITFGNCDEVTRWGCPLKNNDCDQEAFIDDKPKWKSYKVAVNKECIGRNHQHGVAFPEAINESSVKFTDVTVLSGPTKSEPAEGLIEDGIRNYKVAHTYKIQFDYKNGRKLKWDTDRSGKSFEGPSPSYEDCPGAFIETTGVITTIKLSGRNSILI